MSSSSGSIHSPAPPAAPAKHAATAQTAKPTAPAASIKAGAKAHAPQHPAPAAPASSNPQARPPAHGAAAPPAPAAAAAAPVHPAAPAPPEVPEQPLRDEEVLEDAEDYGGDEEYAEGGAEGGEEAEGPSASAAGQSSAGTGDVEVPLGPNDKVVLYFKPDELVPPKYAGKTADWDGSAIAPMEERTAMLLETFDQRGIGAGSGTKLWEHCPYQGCIAIEAPPHVMDGLTFSSAKKWLDEMKRRLNVKTCTAQVHEVTKITCFGPVLERKPHRWILLHDPDHAEQIVLDGCPVFSSRGDLRPDGNYSEETYKAVMHFIRALLRQAERDIAPGKLPYSEDMATRWRWTRRDYVTIANPMLAKRLCELSEIFELRFQSCPITAWRREEAPDFSGTRVFTLAIKRAAKFQMARVMSAMPVDIVLAYHHCGFKLGASLRPMEMLSLRLTPEEAEKLEVFMEPAASAATPKGYTVLTSNASFLGSDGFEPTDYTLWRAFPARRPGNRRLPPACWRHRMTCLYGHRHIECPDRRGAPNSAPSGRSGGRPGGRSDGAPGNPSAGQASGGAEPVGGGGRGGGGGNAGRASAKRGASEPDPDPREEFFTPAGSNSNSKRPRPSYAEAVSASNAPAHFFQQAPSFAWAGAPPTAYAPAHGQSPWLAGPFHPGVAAPGAAGPHRQRAPGQQAFMQPVLYPGGFPFDASQIMLSAPIALSHAGAQAALMHILSSAQQH
eukprot:tig00000158_g10217.t1